MRSHSIKCGVSRSPGPLAIVRRNGAAAPGSSRHALVEFAFISVHSRFNCGLEAGTLAGRGRSQENNMLKKSER